MGRGKSSFFASLFGCKKQVSAGGRQEESAAARPPLTHRAYQGCGGAMTTIDDYYGQNCYQPTSASPAARQTLAARHHTSRAPLCHYLVGPTLPDTATPPHLSSARTRLG
uniref:Uncharacterized protein n=1 Tax=Zea mays TaxID=4577 RepID=A0A804QIN0_MAIZE